MFFKIITSELAGSNYKPKDNPFVRRFANANSLRLLDLTNKIYNYLN
jgi:hypothetical protein